VSWSSALTALLDSPVVGDVLLQTDAQAVSKGNGLGESSGRRALVSHVATYTLAFVPALVWIGRERGAPRAAGLGASVAIPHLLVDDGWLVRAWLHRVKRVPEPPPALSIAVDQGFHVVCLLGAAIVATR
jgi:2-methylcitrate dehydratase PrpD